jgi:hypothetical protein
VLNKRKFFKLLVFCYDPGQVENNQSTKGRRNDLSTDSPPPSMLFQQVKKTPTHRKHGDRKTKNDKPGNNVLPDKLILYPVPEQPAKIS